jgi:hypothetical protein
VNNRKIRYCAEVFHRVVGGVTVPTLVLHGERAHNRMAFPARAGMNR